MAVIFCSCTRGLWMKRQGAMRTNAAIIIREVVIASRFTAALMAHVGTEITIMLGQRLQTTFMGQYTQHYGEATAGMSIV